MVETKKVPVSERRTEEVNAAKRSRGDFIHGANWALKWMRENNPSTLRAGFGGTTQVVYPQHDYITQAARQRFPLKETRRRVVRLGYVGAGREVYLRVAPEGVAQIQFFLDPGCTRPLLTLPQLTPSVVAAMADLMARPDEEVDV